MIMFLAWVGGTTLVFLGAMLFGYLGSRVIIRCIAGYWDWGLVDKRLGVRLGVGLFPLDKDGSLDECGEVR